MPLNSGIKICVASVSLGQHPSHTLERKFQAAADNNFDGIEVVYKDLVSFAELRHISLVAAASLIKELAEKHSLAIVSINPLRMFEGHLGVPLQQRLEVVKEWVDIARALGTKIIQMPSQMDPDSTGDESVILGDLRAMAEIGSTGGEVISFAYEAVAFAIHNPLWEDSLRIVQAVDRPNFGICLDNFHVHARLWGDATVPGGKILGGEEVVRESLRRILEICPKEKVLYIQLSGAKLFDPPLIPGHEFYDGLEVKDPRLAWSRSARPFPLEDGDYFPVMELAKVWLDEFGWDGWVSMESFLADTKKEELGPEVMGRRGWESWMKFVDGLS